jgi:HAD superfamily hydrolase (TIGR01484 family)
MKLIAFDLDGTLAPSKSPLPKEMAGRLKDLLDLYPVCVISGGAIQQFQTQLLDNLPSDANTDNLHLMPTCGTKYYRYKSSQLELIYEENLTDKEKREAIIYLESLAKALNYWEYNPYGDIIEDRGSQITFSALGQKAPEKAKSAWDPYGDKRHGLKEALSAILPDLEVRSGGSTSIDITRKGIDKAYGLFKLSEYTGIDTKDMLFMGDRLDLGGNDYPVISTGCKYIKVNSWNDTIREIDVLLSADALFELT